MPEESFDHLLAQLNSRDPEEAWSVFLAAHSATILRIVRHLEQDSDSVPDCFQFVCEALCANSFHRLKKFRPGGPALFSTWLRAVVRNLCLDWRRKQFGRHRFFKSIARLSGFDQEVFRHLYERRVSLEEALEAVRSIFPNTTRAEVAESIPRIEKVLTGRQRQMLEARVMQQGSQTSNFDLPAASVAAIPDPSPNPEGLAELAQQALALKRALGRLPPQDRLLIRLRFDQELTLDQVAKLLDMGNAQRAERQIKAVLSRLRKELE